MTIKYVKKAKAAKIKSTVQSGRSIVINLKSNARNPSYKPNLLITYGIIFTLVIFPIFILLSTMWGKYGL